MSEHQVTHISFLPLVDYAYLPVSWKIKIVSGNISKHDNTVELSIVNPITRGPALIALTNNFDAKERNYLELTVCDGDEHILWLKTKTKLPKDFFEKERPKKGLIIGGAMMDPAEIGLT